MNKLHDEYPDPGPEEKKYPPLLVFLGIILFLAVAWTGIWAFWTHVFVPAASHVFGSIPHLVR
jgi:hypothetical protein